MIYVNLIFYSFSKMSFLVIGDTHIKTSNIPDIEELFKEIIRISKERINEYSAIVFLGDIFDKHEIVHTEVLTLATNFFYELSLIKPLYILIGNHDRPNNSDFLTNRHALNALKYWNNTYIIDTTQKFTIENKNFLFVPYVPPGRFNEAIEKFFNEGITCIFAHQEFKNCDLGGGIKSLNGDEWNKNIYIVSGHIHDYNRLNEYILYIGTPIQQTYGESSEKSISLIKFLKKEMREETNGNVEQKVRETNGNVEQKVREETNGNVEQKVREETNGNVEQKVREEMFEERIKLNVHKKIEYNLTSKELLDFHLPEKTKCRLIINGTQTEIKSLSEVIKNLKKNNNLILKYNITNNIELVNTKNDFKKYSYLEKLNFNIIKSKNKDNLIWCFQNI